MTMAEGELSVLGYRLLERWGIDALPFDPTAAAFSEGIAVKAVPPALRGQFPALAKGEAALLTGSGEPVLLLLSSAVDLRRRFTLSHELAHWALDGCGGEQDADALAGLLLCPPVVLHLCAVRQARQIASLCQVSALAASVAFSQMTARRKAGDFLQQPEERRCAERFLPFISKTLSQTASNLPNLDL